MGQKKPNAWGLYDMHGIANEWCLDWLGAYPAGAVTDPTGSAGPLPGKFRVFPGGSFVTNSTYCRAADRSRNVPAARIIDNGLRVVVYGSGVR